MPSDGDSDVVIIADSDDEPSKAPMFRSRPAAAQEAPDTTAKKRGLKRLRKTSQPVDDPSQAELSVKHGPLFLTASQSNSTPATIKLRSPQSPPTVTIPDSDSSEGRRPAKRQTLRLSNSPGTQDGDLAQSLGLSEGAETTDEPASSAPISGSAFAAKGTQKGSLSSSRSRDVAQTRGREGQVQRGKPRVQRKPGLNQSQGSEPGKKGSLFALLAAAPKAAQALPNSTQSKQQIASSKATQGDRLWSSKYAPKKEADLVVHKKKLTALRDFLALHTAEQSSSKPPSLLFITGPPGCGKSVSARIVASEMGFDVVEWEAPVPTLWSEHVLQGDREQQYMSKLDAFDSFVAHAKLAPLSLAAVAEPRLQPDTGSGRERLNGDSARFLPKANTGATNATEHSQEAAQGSAGMSERSLGSVSPPETGMLRQSMKRRKVIIVDDLPHAAGPDQRNQLTDAISLLAETARCPVILIMTSSLSAVERKTSVQGANQLLQSGLSRIVEASDGIDLPFNAIPGLAGSKVLLRIAEAEHMELTTQQAKLMVENSSGDLLNAVETLQLFGQGKQRRPPAGHGRKKSKTAKAKAAKKNAVTECEKAELDPLQRDRNLSTFHALGRLLYNKREGDPRMEPERIPMHTSQPSLAAKENVTRINISERFERRRMVYNADEVVSASGMDATQVVQFLQQNYLDFINQDAIEDATAASMYMSEADMLLRQGGPVIAETSIDASSAGHTIREACGYSAAARGLMWSIKHPAPTRWLPLKSSQLSMLQKAMATNLAQLQTRAHTQWSGESHRQRAIETLPYLRVLTSFPVASHLRPLLPAKWCRIWDGNIEVDNQLSESETHLTSAFDDMHAMHEAIDSSGSDFEFDF